jgi:hypothetical protein
MCRREPQGSACTAAQVAMKEEWAKRWVGALISDKYPQTKRSLHNAEGYDPIGVLADISGLGYYSSVRIEEADDSGLVDFSFTTTAIKHLQRCSGS